jgi:ABC-type polysaccharide/polyol phosphate export permease
MKKQLKELFAFRELLLNLVINELKLRYRNSLLGFLWTILNPLFYLLILAVVFSKIIRFEIENYTIFLFAGLTSWLMIQQTITTATASIVNNQALIRRVYVPKMVFPLSNVIARYIDHLILTAILLIFMVFFKAPFTWRLLLVPVVILMHFFFSLGLSLLAAVADIKIRDVQHIVSIIFQALFYITPIIYSADILPAKYRPLFLANPFYYFVESFRFPVYRGALPPWDIALAAVGLTVLSFGAGFWIFSRKEKYFVFHLS